MKLHHVFLFPALLLSATATAATIVGTNLDIGTSNTFLSEPSGAIGYNNHISQVFSLVIGKYNDVIDDDNENSSFAVGQYNTLEGSYAIISGSYNQVYADNTLTSGILNYNDAYSSIVGGRGHILSGDAYTDALVIGRYSSPISLNKKAHLVVGNGTSSSLRANSFIVYADGDIIISKPQGDISMGDYDD